MQKPYHATRQLERSYLTGSADGLVPRAGRTGHASITLDTRVRHVGVRAVEPSRAQEAVVDVTARDDIPDTQ